MTLSDVTVMLGILCLIQMIWLIQAKISFYKLKETSQKYISVQGTFSRAVAGIEANLEKEKCNSSRLMGILDTIHDGVALMDEEGRLIYANTALWKLYEIVPSERKKYMNESWVKLHSPKGQAQIINNVFPVLEQNNVWMGESDVLTQKGELIRAELYISKSTAGYIGFIRNVSSRYQAEQENRRLSIQLHELKKYEAIERAVRNIVHEFSNSLSAVTGLSELLADEVDEKSATAVYAKKICASGLQMQYSLDKARALLPNAKRPNAFCGLPATIDLTLPTAPEAPLIPVVEAVSSRKI